jgi:hypothetical protein
MKPSAKLSRLLRFARNDGVFFSKFGACHCDARHKSAEVRHKRRRGTVERRRGTVEEWRGTVEKVAWYGRKGGVVW